MADPPDTGDYLRHVPTQTHHVTACVHEDVIYTAGNPSRTLRVADCEIVQRASPAERLASLQAWANGAWTQRSTTGPARSNHGMAFDGTKVVLFGGMLGSNQDLSDDTWLWDGAAWSRFATTTRPPSRAEPAMAYDPRGGRVLLFGGRGLALGAKNDLWEWRGAGWSEVVSTNRPQPRYGASLAWDPARRKIVLFGGTNAAGFGNTYLQDTWEWDGTDWILRADQRAAEQSGRRADVARHRFDHLAENVSDPHARSGKPSGGETHTQQCCGC